VNGGMSCVVAPATLSPSVSSVAATGSDDRAENMSVAVPNPDDRRDLYLDFSETCSGACSQTRRVCSESASVRLLYDANVSHMAQSQPLRRPLHRRAFAPHFGLTDLALTPASVPTDPGPMNEIRCLRKKPHLRQLSDVNRERCPGSADSLFLDGVPRIGSSRQFE
jgi:hypothetical protein